MEITHDKMMPGDLLEYRCPRMGLVWQWRVLGIYLGSERQESLINVQSTFLTPGADATCMAYDHLMVPEPMTRSLTVVRPGLTPAETKKSKYGRDH